MALKEINETFPELDNLVSIKQKEETFDSATRGIKVVYINNELDSSFSSQLSSNDWKLLKSRLNNPQYNEKLANLLETESIFD